MEVVFLILLVPVLALALFFSLYLVLLTVAAVVVPRRNKRMATKYRKFAIVIPAHNEEKVIEGTLRSAFSIAYPREMFDVIVVADNCTDQTAGIALGAGAIVFQRFDPRRGGKGYALNWIIPQILEGFPAPGYDACVFVDADSVISENFLEEMNYALESGQRIIQSRDLVRDNSNSWRVQLMLVAFLLQNYVRPLGKSCLGLSVPLKGNGMCFSTDVLRTLRWDETSLGEDLDMALELIRRGEKIHFNPAPVVYAIMPEDASSARTQRIRWEGGRFASMRRRVPLVLKEAWRKKSLYIFEAAVDAAFPPLALLLLGSLGFALLNVLLVKGGFLSALWTLWGWVLVLAFMIVHIVIGLMIARVSFKSLLAFLYVPRYLVWKMGVYLSMILGRTQKAWLRTER
jgi:1,2-diacylglycerol 3-beta-glucosyltransferase